MHACVRAYVCMYFVHRPVHVNNMYVCVCTCVHVCMKDYLYRYVCNHECMCAFKFDFDLLNLFIYLHCMICYVLLFDSVYARVIGKMAR